MSDADIDSIIDVMMDWSFNIVNNQGITSAQNLKSSAKLWDAYGSIPGNEELKALPDPFSGMPHVWPTVHEVFLCNYERDKKRFDKTGPVQAR